MSEITQRVKYQVEFDASGLDKLSALVTEARQQFEAMGKTAQEVATNFNTLRNSKIKVTHTIRDTAAAVKVETAAVEEQKVELEGATRAIKELERELAKETQSLKANVRALDENAVANSRLAQEAEKSRRVASLMAQVLGKSGKVLDQFNEGAEKAIKATDKMSESTQKAAGSKFMLLQTYAKFFVVKNLLLESFNQIREGAQNLDITKTLRSQLGNYDQMVADINKATANTIKEADLNRSVALMSSFGLPAEQFARMMELVAKAAIRTGQSTDFLADSLARGVSRMSPLILDNLGIQIKLSDAYDEWAAKLGKASDELTKNEQQAAVLNATLEAVSVTTRGIMLEGMAGTAVAQAEKFFADAWLRIQEAGAQALQFLIERHASAEQQVRRHADAYQGISDALRRLTPEAAEFFRRFGIFGVRDILGGASSAMDTLIAKWEIFGGKINDYGKDLLKTALYGANDPDKARAEIEEIFQYLADVEAGKYRGRGMQSTGTAKKRATGLALGLGLDTLQTEIDITFAKLNDEINRTLTAEQRITLQRELQAAQKDREYDLVRLLQTSNGDLRKLAQDMTKLDQDRLNKLEEMVRKRLEDTRLSNDANHASRAAVDAIQDAVDHRQRELEFASKTHILSIDANKAAERESALIKQIADVRKDYFDEEKAAERGSNKARLEALNTARQLAATQSNAARQAWELEDERLDMIIKSGKEAVKAEITRLETFIEQNKALLQQLEIYKFLPGVGTAIALAITQIRNETESATDSLARLKAEAAGIGNASGREAILEDMNELVPGETTQKSNERRNRARQLFREWREAMKAAEKEMQSQGGGMLGVSPEFMKGHNDFIAKWQKTVEDEFYGMQDFRQALEYNDKLLERMGWRYDDINQQLEAFMKHIELMKDLADGFHKVEVALQDIGNAITPLSGLFEGTFGEETGQGIVSMVTQMSGALGQMSEALEQNANAYGLMNGAIGISRAVTSNIIKDLRARAGFEAMFQTALSAAAFATGNIPGGIAHAAAAALFATIAGRGKPKAADKDKTKGMGGAGSMNVARSDVHVHIQGTVVQTEAERGMMIQRAIREARAGGR